MVIISVAITAVWTKTNENKASKPSLSYSSPFLDVNRKSVDKEKKIKSYGESKHVLTMKPIDSPILNLPIDISYISNETGEGSAVHEVQSPMGGVLYLDNPIILNEKDGVTTVSLPHPLSDDLIEFSIEDTSDDSETTRMILHPLSKEPLPFDTSVESNTSFNSEDQYPYSLPR